MRHDRNLDMMVVRSAKDTHGRVNSQVDRQGDKTGDGRFKLGGTCQKRTAYQQGRWLTAILLHCGMRADQAQAL